MVRHSAFKAQNEENMDLYCPFCSKPIALETTKCPSCGQVYNSDTHSSINLSAKGHDEFPHERRKQGRFPLRLKVAFSTPQEFVERYIFNIGPGGLFIESKTPLKPGDELDLKIFLHETAEPLEIPCEVMWCRKEEQQRPDGKLPTGMGVKFLRLSKENAERVIGLLNRSRS